jgi:hypothetical protein
LETEFATTPSSPSWIELGKRRRRFFDGYGIAEPMRQSVLRMCFTRFVIELSRLFVTRCGTTAHATSPARRRVKTRASRRDGWGSRRISFESGVCAGYPQIAEIVDMAAVEKVLPDVEAHARELRATKRNSVKHNRGTHIFEAGNGP